MFPLHACLDIFRNFSQSVQCLKEHHGYCNPQGQTAINITLEMLTNMEYIVCMPNKLQGDDPGCVAMGTANVTMATACNVTELDSCVSAIHKANKNPFISRQQFCRFVHL